MRALKAVYHNLRKRFYGVREYEIPVAIRARMRSLSAEKSRQLQESLRVNYYTSMSPEEFEAIGQTDVGRENLEDHMRRRQETFRTTAIPWISSLVDLSGKTVLEIGCGTGSSTVALAEQGAIVTAIDEDPGSLRAARTRTELHDLQPTFLELNSSAAFERFPAQSFDIIGMFAVVEHMTLQERLSALREAWALLKSGGYLIVVEAPNRLWLEDQHTSLEDFYWWLPDDLAMLWTKRTSRAELAAAFDPRPDESAHDREVRLARWGRGVSYHEFCLAFDCAPHELPVASARELFFREQQNEEKIYAHMWYRRYEQILHERHPGIHRGFFLRDLDLAFRKP